MKEKILIIVGILIILSSSVNLYGWIWANDSDIALAPPNGDEMEKSSPTINQIRLLIIDGADHFYKSKGYYALFLSAFEKSNIDEMHLNFCNAVDGMEKTNGIYRNIIDISNDCGYNPDIVDKLKSFDYSQYQIDNNLNPFVFDIVKKYLSKGDVKGMYYELYRYTETIRTELVALLQSGTLDKSNILKFFA